MEASFVENTNKIRTSHAGVVEDSLFDVSCGAKFGYTCSFSGLQRNLRYR